MSQEVVDNWRNILREENIGEQEAANAFYRAAEGEDTTREQGYYANAKKRFKEIYGDIPVLVKSWKLKK